LRNVRRCTLQRRGDPRRGNVAPPHRRAAALDLSRYGLVRSLPYQPSESQRVSSICRSLLRYATSDAIIARTSAAWPPMSDHRRPGSATPGDSGEEVRCRRAGGRLDSGRRV